MAWLSRIANTLRLARLHHQLDEELQLHLELSARDLEKSGQSRDAARSEAALRLGNITSTKEKTREMDIATALETTGRDLQYAIRQLLRNRAFTAVALTSLALGIGANTAVFSIFNAVLLKSLPVRNADELVILTDPDASGVSIGSSSGERALLSYTEYTHLRERATTPSSGLSEMCASSSGLNRWSLRISGGPQEAALGRLVSENYFSVLGVQTALGRVFTQTGTLDVGSDPYAVISYDYWQRRFGGRSDVLGTHVRLYQAAVTVIGVTKAGFRGETGGENPDLWVPMMMEPLVKPGRDWIHEDLTKSIDKVMWLHVFARRKPGVSLARIQAEVNVVFESILEENYPATLAPAVRKDLLRQSLKVRTARTGAFGGRDQLRQQLTVLLVVAGLVLLIACANVANLLLARATARQREVGVRLSLGAGRGRLIRQFLTESLLLSVLGAAAGIVLAAVSAKALVLAAAEQNENLNVSVPFDWRVLAFTLAVATFTGLLFGLVPALRAARADIIATTKESGRAATDSAKRLAFGKNLVSAQLALSLLLVSGAGLFLRTLWNLQSVALGFSREHLLLLRIDAVTAGYNDASRPALFDTIAGRLRALPGVRGVAYSENGLFGGTDSGDPVDVEGFVHQSKEEDNARFDQLGPDYFSSLGIPLLLGREITRQDTATSPRVCVINEAFASRFFPGRNPIGRHVTDTYGGGKLTMTVIGVARNVRDHRLRGDVPPRFYVPVTQNDGGVPPSIYFEIRTTGATGTLLNAARKTILQVDSGLPILLARSLDELIDSQNYQPRLIAQLCSVFGAIALLLAATGLYGALSYMVTRRTNEIGIRMALGAAKGTIARMILRETAFIVAIGLAVGLIATVAATRLVATKLYGIGAMDPVTIAAAALLLSLVAWIAGYIPAARAARVNPISALRHE